MLRPSSHARAEGGGVDAQEEGRQEGGSQERWQEVILKERNALLYSNR